MTLKNTFVSIKPDTFMFEIVMNSIIYLDTQNQLVARLVKQW